ncbi:MAG TPA: AgmX/PglI C-terminal domain-containing protein, partial [Polyangiaceae bacterium]|nr:AgmX/PglI C-terminal domain-containing protein [Polyangiaceae bacterium]
PSGSNGPSHNLSREYLQQRIREDFYPMAKVCYEGALAKQPELRGQIVIDFVIVGDAKVGGIVDQAKINDRTDVTDVTFLECIRESMLSMVFAPPDNGGWVTVTYPFKFSPDKEEAPRDQ